jgi:hypothetical protein
VPLDVDPRVARRYAIEQTVEPAEGIYGLEIAAVDHGIFVSSTELRSK